MQLLGSPLLVERLFRKRELLLQGDRANEEIRTMLVGLGGDFRGVRGAGAAIALHRLGLAHCFDVVAGFSACAAILGFFLGGEYQTTLGSSLYYMECLKHFISFRRWPMADIDYLEGVMRLGSKRLDIDAVVKHRSQFYVGVTDWETGEGCLLDVKKAQPDPLTAIKASMAITELYAKPVVVNGRYFTDGTMSMPFPAQKLVEQFRPTDILILANQSQGSALNPPTVVVSALTRIAMRKMSDELRKYPPRWHHLWKENLEYLRSSNLNVGIFWGPESVYALTRNYHTLRSAVEEG